jgi:hypothetical protein
VLAALALGGAVVLAGCATTNGVTTFSTTSPAVQTGTPPEPAKTGIQPGGAFPEYKVYPTGFG